MKSDDDALKGNYLNLQAGQEDQYMYRIISLKRLYELFGQQHNVLVRPAKWDDPFENFILNSRARLSDGTIVQFGFKRDFFGQCWTLQPRSDAIWRIYSPDATSVRVRTTVRRLLEGLETTFGQWAHVQAFIGKVRYLRDAELRAFGNTVFRDGLNPPALAQTLLIKRRAFVHEKEVRLLYLEKEASKEDLFSYPVNPHAMIDQIMIDPRLAQEKVNQVKKEIKQKTSFCGDIKRSLLYAPPEDMIFPITDK